MGIAKSDRALLLDCRDLAHQLKNSLKELEGHSNLWEMADAIYRDLAGRSRKDAERLGWSLPKEEES